MRANRRRFLSTIGLLAASSAMPLSAFDLLKDKKLKVAVVGTGIRAITFWGKRLQEQYSEILEFIALSDINPGRMEYAKKYIGIECPTYTDFDEMLAKNKPELLIVTTKDANHDEFIIKGLEAGCDVLTEKPMTTDEVKCQAILDAERKSGKKLIVGFNYRWIPYMTKIKELLMENKIGKLTSIDLNWYLDTYHGASYFRRWHGLMHEGGSLWVHKATHHFDLLNWWIDSEPEKVFAMGDLEQYGSNGKFRGENCRSCEFKDKCDYFYDITKDENYMNLYVANEKYDGYIRDNCVFRKEINIYDKMSALIKYKNNVQVNYSLTTYSPFEGWRLALNGTEGRIEAWWGIPSREEPNGMKLRDHHKNINAHSVEMDQSGNEKAELWPIITHQNFNLHQTERVPMTLKGHGGGDKRLHDQIFLDKEKDPYGRSAGVRDGAMSVLVGVAARRSIESGEPVQIASLTDLQPREKRLSE